MTRRLDASTTRRSVLRGALGLRPRGADPGSGQVWAAPLIRYKTTSAPSLPGP